MIKKKSAKEMWDAIEDYLEGDALCKKTKKYEIERRYNNFVKRPNESLRETYDRYCEVVNACISLGKVMTDEEINMNFLNALGSKWMHKATSLEDSKCLSTWSLSNLYANLRVHELKLDRMEEVDVRIKSLSMSALDHEEKQPSKPTTDSTISTSSLVDMDDEEFAMFVKRFQKFRKNSKPFSNSKSFSKGKPSASFSKGFDAKKKGELVCYNCRKPGHFASECPQPRFEFMKRKPSTSKFSRRKGMVAEEEENSKELATWIETDSDEESEDDTEEVNLCLVVKDASSDSEEDVPTKPQKLKDVVVSKKDDLIFNSDGYELTPSRKIGNRSFSRPIFPSKNQPILETKSIPISKKLVEDVSPMEQEEMFKKAEMMIGKFESVKKALSLSTDEISQLKTEKALMKSEIKSLKDQIKSMTPLAEQNHVLEIKNAALKIRNDDLVAQNVDLQKVIDEWTKSRVTMDQILESQKTSGDKEGLGFPPSDNFKCASCIEKDEKFSKQTSEAPKGKNDGSKGKGQEPKKKLDFSYVYPKNQTGKGQKGKGKTKGKSTTIVPETDIPSTSTAHGSVTGHKVTAPMVTGNKAKVKTSAKSTVSKEKVVKSMKAHFVKEKSSKPAKHSEPKSVMKYVKTQFVSGFHHCSVCDSYGHKAAECLLRFTSNPKGHNPPSVRQVWVIKRN